MTSIGESTLAHSSERYASMFTYHPHAAYSVDRRGYYTDANPRALEMTGLTLQEMRQTHFAQVIHPEDLHLIQDGFDRAMAGEPALIDARVVRADGGIVDIRCTAIPVVVGGEVVGVHGITEDVTAANQVLRELEEANNAKTLFLATVSHEVRTPLAVLVGATDLLLDADLDPEPDHYAQMVRRSSERLMQLVDDILEFSGLDEHQTVLHPRPFGVRAVVEDVAAWAVPFAESRNLAISFVVDDSVPAASVGDSLRVGQVMTTSYGTRSSSPSPAASTCGSLRVRPSVPPTTRAGRPPGSSSRSPTRGSASRRTISAPSSSPSPGRTRMPPATARASGSAWPSAVGSSS